MQSIVTSALASLARLRLWGILQYKEAHIDYKKILSYEIIHTSVLVVLWMLCGVRTLNIPELTAGGRINDARRWKEPYLMHSAPKK